MEDKEIFLTAISAVTKTGIEEPLAALRILKRDGKRALQQKWRVMEYGPGKKLEVFKYEWRDVPEVSEP